MIPMIFFTIVVFPAPSSPRIRTRISRSSSRSLRIIDKSPILKILKKRCIYQIILLDYVCSLVFKNSGSSFAKIFELLGRQICAHDFAAMSFNHFAHNFVDKNNGSDGIADFWNVGALRLQRCVVDYLAFKAIVVDNYLLVRNH